MRLWSRLGGLVRKLQRRGVLRASAVYAVGAWVAVQVAAATFPALPVPGWAHTLVVLLSIFGLPVVVAVAWAYEITPEGVRRTVEEEQPPELIRARGTPWGALLLVGVVTVASAGLGWTAWDVWLSPGMQATAARADSTSAAEADLPRTRIAVLPFEGANPADSTRTVADGLTLALIKDLDRIPELDVVSYRGVRAYRDTDVPLDSVARAMGAGSVVSGVVQRSGDSLVVTMQLVDARRATTDWTGTLRASRDSLLMLRDEVLTGAVRGLRRALGQELQTEATRTGTDSDVAWELFHRGKRLAERGNELRQDGQREIAGRLYRRADSLFMDAKERDPDWREPTLERGWLELDRAQLPGRAFTDMDSERLRIGIEHADRAVSATGGGDPAALELRGALLNALSYLPLPSDSVAALRGRAMNDLQRAVGQDPDRARAWAELSDLHRRAARFQDARVAARNAREADAFLINEVEYLEKAMYVALDLGRLDEAVELALRGRRLFPEDVSWDQALLLAISAPGGPVVSADSAWSVLRHFEHLLGRESPFARIQVAAALARRGADDSARAVLRRATAAVPEGGQAHAWYYEANVRMHLGQRDRAFDLLERYLQKLPNEREYVRQDVYWAPVRDDSTFRTLVAARG